MTVAELIAELQGFDPDMNVRLCTGRKNEYVILSVYAVTRAEARRQGVRATGTVAGLWIDLAVKNED